MTPDQLSTVISQHERYARRLPGGARIQFRMTNLSGIVAQRRLLHDAYFMNCDLTDARFALSDLSRATFYASSLIRADLRGCKLTNSDLRGSALGGARLYAANLEGADMREAQLAIATGAADETASARAWGTNKMRETVSLREASLKKARLTNAKLDGADFGGAILSGATFDGASLRGACFDGAILAGVEFKHCRIEGASFVGVLRDPDDAARAAMPALLAALANAEQWATSNGKAGAPMIADGADLRVLGDTLQGRILAGCRLRDCIAVGVNFSSSVLVGANFDGADLREARFDNCDLRGASFRNCKLSHASFSGADLRDLEKVNGQKHPPNFAGALAGCLDLTGARYDSPALFDWIAAGSHHAQLADQTQDVLAS